MAENQFLQNLWTSISLDEREKVREVRNPDDRLFFGKHPVQGDSLSSLFPDDSQARQQSARIFDGIERAARERRNVYLTYISSDQVRDVSVGMFVEYSAEGICLHATAIDVGDLLRSQEVSVENALESKLRQIVFEHLPVGLEIYDGNGRLIEINSQELQSMGIPHKKDVLGLKLFANPNLPGNIREQLLAGEDVYFTSDYDFSKAMREGYYPTTKSGNRLLTVSISVIRNSAGKIENYLLISQDITELVQYQQRYETLYNQNMTILNSLPVGVEIYNPAGTLVYLTENDCQIFGVDRDEVLSLNLNVDDNPNLSQEIKDAVHRGEPIVARFPYRFDAVAEQDYYTTSQTQKILQIECTGQPVIGADGKLQNYVFIVQDVTEDVRREEELRQSKQKTEVATHDADVMLWEFDTQNQLFFSENEPLTGYDSERAITIAEYTDCLYPEDREVALGFIQRMTAGEDFSFSFDVRLTLPGNSELQYCTLNGTPYERDADGKVIRFVGSRKNNTELQQQKVLQETILNSIPVSIHIKDIEDNFRYVFCNDESTRLFGTTVDMTTYDVMKEEEVARIEKTDMEVFTTGRPYLGLEHIDLQDGRSYDVIVRKSVIDNGNKRLLLSIRWDQSLQNELQRRSKVLSLSMQAMNAYTWFYDPEKDRVSFGDGFERMGRNAQQVNSREKFAACIHPEDRQLFVDTQRAQIEKGSGEWVVEYRVDLEGSGTYEWWETRGLIDTSIINDVPHKYMLGMSINIDSHKRTELTLLRNKEELNQLVRQNELVLNNTNSGLAFITPDYVVQWENVSMCSASLSYEAYKKGEFCYKSAHGRTSPCEDCVLQRSFHSCQTEQIKFTLNNNRTVEIFGTPVLNDNGEVDGIVIRVDDVTERERMIEELRQAKALAEQSDKLKSAFLANMSHEIRTPLNAIVGFSDLLVSTDEKQEREEYMQIINNNNELLLKLINDILDLSKIEAGSVELKYEEFDLSEYFDGMAASMKQRVTNPEVQLVARNPYEECIVKLDRNRIAQILTNYVTNAIKYTPHGLIEMGYESVDAGIRFYVRDSGIGIAEEKKNKVFHRFEKLDEFAQGTGLGLSICKAIAESMGGSVGFESTYGEGSLFWAVLPCDPEIRTEILPQGDMNGTDGMRNDVPGQKTEPVSGRKTILVAEDIPSNYLLISALLKKNYDLLHAVNGQEAVDMARTHTVDLLLMDMKMPVMDGLTATREIRKFDQVLPIVALTAHAFNADHEAAIAAGCNEYLVKPIDKVRLMSVLREYCDTSGTEK